MGSPFAAKCNDVRTCIAAAKCCRWRPSNARSQAGVYKNGRGHVPSLGVPNGAPTTLKDRLPVLQAFMTRAVPQTGVCETPTPRPAVDQVSLYSRCPEIASRNQNPIGLYWDEF